MCAGKLGLILLFGWVSITIAQLPDDVHFVYTPEFYKYTLATRRVNQKILIQRLSDTDPEKNYKMISMAMERIFKSITRNRQILVDYNYKAAEGFPTTNPKQTAVRELVEMTCLLADVIQNFPDISYEILGTIPNWKHTVNWCIDFVLSMPYVIDELVDALMKYFSSQINYDERNPHTSTPNYLKPATRYTTTQKPKKPRKKLKRGPRMTVRADL